MLRRTGMGILALALLMAGTLPLARAERLVARRQRVVKACVGLLTPVDDPQGLLVSRGAITHPRGYFIPTYQYYPNNSFVFQVLDQRLDLKPDGLRIVNPAAPATITQNIALRWNAVAGLTGQPGVTVGQPLTPDYAAYWEVPLIPENYSVLAQMDIIYLSIRRLAAPGPGAPGPTNRVHLTEDQRRLLLRLVDAGVLLWIDHTTPGGDPLPGQPATGEIGGDGAGGNPTGLPFRADFTAAPAGPQGVLNPHPLLEAEYRLNATEIGNLGLTGKRGAVLLNPQDRSAPVPGFQLSPIVGASATLPSIAAGRLGNGYVVMSGIDIGAAIAPAIDPPVRLTSAYQGTRDEEDLKFAYNLIAWIDEFPQPQMGPRRAAESTQVFPGLLERWSVPETPDFTPSVAPLMVDGLVYVANGSAGAGYVGVLQREPADDLDGVGGPDDPGLGLLPDLSFSQSFDQIAATPLGALGLSALGGMAYAEAAGVGWLYLAGRTGGGNGGIVAVRAPSRSSPGTGTFTVAGSATLPGMPIVAAPTYGAEPSPTLYVAGASPFAGQGRIVAYDAIGPALNLAWQYPMSNAANSLGPVHGSPTVAFLTDRRSGAVDHVVLFTSLHNPSGPGGFNGIVTATIGEPLVYPPGNPGDGRTFVPLRRTEPWDPTRWWAIRIVTRDGTSTMPPGLTVLRYTFPDPRVQLNADGQPGRVRLPQPVDLNEFAIVADYSIRPQPDAATGSPTRQRRHFVPAFQPSGAMVGAQSGVAGGVAVGKDDTVYYGTGRGYMAAVEVEGGSPRVRWKARVPAPIGGAGGASGSSQDIDPQSPGYLADFHFTAAPCAGDELVVFAGKNTNGGCLFVFELDATIRFQLPSFTAPLTAANVAQLQLISNDEPPAGGQRIPPNQYQVDVDTGTVTFTDMRAFILDLDQVQRDPATGILYVPIDIRFPPAGYDSTALPPDQKPKVPIPLVYYFASMPGQPVPEFHASPVISGDRVYVLGADGTLFELPVDPRRGDSRFPAGQGTNDPTFYNLARPVNRGLWRQYIPTTLGGAARCMAPPAVGPGCLVVNTPGGVVGYSSSSVLIADRNRLVEASPDGDLHASAEGVISYFHPNQDFPVLADPERSPLRDELTIQRTHLDRPAVARRINRNSSLWSIVRSSAPTIGGVTIENSEVSDTAFLVADTGNDRVVELDPRGRAIWELTTFQDPWNLLPSGEPRRLSRPMDVQRWVDVEIPPGGTPTILVIHTLVADTGNGRVVEIVDKVAWNRFGAVYATLPGQVDANGAPLLWKRVLVWCSQTNAMGLRLPYRCAQRIFWTDAAGNEIVDPDVGGPGSPLPIGRATPFPPYLPPEPKLSVTVCAVNGARLAWPATVPVAQRTVPQAQPGGDTLLFLMGRRVLTAAGIQTAPFRVPDYDAARASNPNRYVPIQGGIYPTLPLITAIYPEGGPSPGERPVVTLGGVASVQRTIRRDPEFFRTGAAPTTAVTAQYYLVTDASGVHEFRLDFGAPPDNAARLAWSFNQLDYAYCATGTPASTLPSGSRWFTPTSARRIANGMVLVTSRTSARRGAGAGLEGLGGDVFLLRPNDFLTQYERPMGTPYDPYRPDLHGWVPDTWVLAALGVPQPWRSSIAWRVPMAPDPTRPPTDVNGTNPVGIGNTYLPDQPAYADLVFAP